MRVARLRAYGSNGANRRSVRLVAPSIARGVSRFMTADVAATQNAASPAPSFATVVPLADTVKDGCAECCFVERDRVTRGLEPQLRLDTRHRASLPSTTSSRSLYNGLVAWRVISLRHRLPASTVFISRVRTRLPRLDRRPAGFAPAHSANNGELPSLARRGPSRARWCASRRP